MVGDLTYFPIPEDDTIVEHLLTEPKIETSLEADADYMKLDDDVTCYEVGAFSYANDCSDLKIDYGRLESDCTKFEFCDSFFNEVDTIKGLPPIGQCTVGESSFLLDTVFIDHGNIHYDIGADDFLQNLHSDLKSEPQSMDVEDDTATISDPFIHSDPTVDSDLMNGTFLDNMSISELHDVFKKTFGRDTFINDKDWLKRQILFGSQNFDNNSPPVNGGPSLKGSEDSLYFLSDRDISGKADGCTNEMQFRCEAAVEMKQVHMEMIAHDTTAPNTVDQIDISKDNIEVGARKRLRRPTRRYIEELSDITSKRNNVKKLFDKVGCLLSTSSDRLADARTTTRFHHEDSSAGLVSGNEQFAKDHDGLFECIIRSRRGRPRKNSAIQAIGSKGVEVSETNDCDLIGNMADNSALKLQKVSLRRKHHRLWSLSEVLKLIEGVSRYGVGRWTEIKRILFSSYAHRTSVDLKDKWRNLLRATGAHIHGKKEASKKKPMSLPIPHSISRRVRELAIMYPYPREKHPKSPSYPSLNVTSTEIFRDGGLTAATHHGKSAQRRVLT